MRVRPGVTRADLRSGAPHVACDSPSRSEMNLSSSSQCTVIREHGRLVVPRQPERPQHQLDGEVSAGRNLIELPGVVKEAVDEVALVVEHPALELL